MRNNFFKIIVLFFLSLLIIKPVSGQCFENLNELSGVDVIEPQEELNLVACKLKAAFPETYQDSFMVFDFGFYSFNEDMDNDAVEEIWEKIKIEASETFPYYLIFGKESNRDGLFTKIRFHYELPSEGNFACITQQELEIVHSSLENELISNFELVKNAPTSYYLAEKAVMEKFSIIIEEIVNCCASNIIESCSICIPADNVIDSYLNSEEFESVNIEFKISDSDIGISKPEDNDIRSGDYVTNLSGLLLNIDGNTVDLEEKIEDNIETFIGPNDNAKIFIVSNKNLCDSSYINAVEELENNLPSMGALIYLRETGFDIDEMYIKTYGILDEDIESLPSYSIGELEENSVSGVTSFQELIDYVRIAEDSLIANGYDEIEDRIHMIRGIYYGTPWSFDYGQMSSNGRNLGFNSYTYSPMPKDPRTYLGTALFDKLFHSPEVKDGSKGIDWGHIIIGLDARRKYIARNVNFALHECTGLEACTWVGDLGGGAGKLAWDRISNPNKRAITKFTTSHFGGWINLEGDVASYLIAKDNNPVFSAPDMALNDEDYIADALEAYLINNENNDWDNRASLFLQMICGNTIDETAINYVASKIEDFGEKYLLLRVKDGANINMIEASSHLKGASKEMAQIFIDALQKGGSRIKGSLDPDPSPKGTPYVKYLASKKLIEFKDKVKDWLKN